MPRCSPGARIARLALLVIAPVAWNAPPAKAQLGSGTPDAITQADWLYFSGAPEQARQLLLTYLETHPSDYQALWRAARVSVGMERVDHERGTQYRWLDPAILLGDRAVAERPEGVEGLYWHGAAEGRRALYAGNSYAAELGQRVYDDAHAILALDSLHGGAHNLLGMLNYEIMDLSRIERFLARLVTDSKALDESSWEAAELHLRRAAELWPEHVLFQLDLARLFDRRGREEEAKEVLRRLLEMPSVHPEDEHLKEEGRRLMEELGPSR